LFFDGEFDRFRIPSLFLFFSDLIIEEEEEKMQLRKQDKMTEENGHDETEKSNSANLHLTDADREKGNLKHFKISKKTIQKLKGKFE
jgi:hypothetical protein